MVTIPFYRVEAKEAIKDPRVHRTAPHTYKGKDYPVHNGNSAAGEEPWIKLRGVLQRGYSGL